MSFKEFLSTPIDELFSMAGESSKGILLVIMIFAVLGILFLLGLRFMYRGIRREWWERQPEEVKRARRQKELQDNLNRELLKAKIKDLWFK